MQSSMKQQYVLQSALNSKCICWAIYPLNLKIPLQRCNVKPSVFNFSSQNLKIAPSLLPFPLNSSLAVEIFSHRNSSLIWKRDTKLLGYLKVATHKATAFSTI